MHVLRMYIPIYIQYILNNANKTNSNSKRCIYTLLLLNYYYYRCFSVVGTRLNATNTTGLDEYVDILQVQQLLLDSSSSMGPAASAIASSSAVSNNAAAIASATSRNHRPRVNIQKASDYSTSLLSSTTTASGLAGASAIPTTPQVQGEKENEQEN